MSISDKLKMLANPIPTPDALMEQLAIREVVRALEQLGELFQDIGRLEASRAGNDFSFVLKGELSEKAKNTLIDLIASRGWWVLNIRNSSEGGERPGLCGLTLTIPNTPA